MNNKDIFTLSIVFLVLCIVSCRRPNGPSVVNDECRDIPKLTWQKASGTVNSDDIKKLALDLTAAAKTDSIAISKVVSASANATANLSSELSKVVKSNLTVSSEVSQEFWQQDLTYRQVLCHLNAISQRTDISDTEKSEVLKAILSFSTLRINYTFQKKNLGQ